MEKTIQHKLEEALALYRKAEEELDAAIESGKRKAIRAAEKALEEAEENLQAIEDEAGIEADGEEYFFEEETAPEAEPVQGQPQAKTAHQIRLQEALADFYMAEADLDAAIESGKRRKIKAAEKALEEAEQALRAIEDEEDTELEQMAEAPIAEEAPIEEEAVEADAAEAEEEATVIPEEAPIEEAAEDAAVSEEAPVEEAVAAVAAAAAGTAVQQELEAVRAAFHKAEGALDAAMESGNKKVISAAEKALEEAEEALHAVEDAAALEAEQADAKAVENAVEEAKEELEQAEEAAEKLQETARAKGDFASAAAAAAAIEAMDEAEDALDDAEDIIEDDAEARPGKKKTGLVIGIVLAVLALLGGGGYYYYTNYYLPAMQAPAEEAAPVQVLMPDVVMETADVAESMLAEMGVEADVLFVASEKVPAGIVTLQSISPGQPLEDEVVLYVSMGPAPTPTPDRGPLPTPTPSPTPKPVRTAPPVIELPVETPCPTG